MKPDFITKLKKRKKLTTLLGLALDGSRLEGVVLKRTNGSLQKLQSFSVTHALDPQSTRCHRRARARLRSRSAIEMGFDGADGIARRFAGSRRDELVAARSGKGISCGRHEFADR
jgi:hypothetical protein